MIDRKKKKIEKEAKKIEKEAMTIIRKKNVERPIMRNTKIIGKIIIIYAVMGLVFIPLYRLANNQILHWYMRKRGIADGSLIFMIAYLPFYVFALPFKRVRIFLWQYSYPIRKYIKYIKLTILPHSPIHLRTTLEKFKDVTNLGLELASNTLDYNYSEICEKHIEKHIETHIDLYSSQIFYEQPLEIPKKNNIKTLHEFMDELVHLERALARSKFPIVLYRVKNKKLYKKIIRKRGPLF